MKCRKAKMNTGITIIGGSDGPTAIYLAKRPKRERQADNWGKGLAAAARIAAILAAVLLVASFCNREKN